MEKLNDFMSNNATIDQVARCVSKLSSTSMNEESRLKWAKLLNECATREAYSLSNPPELLSSEQLARLDEIDNAVFDLIKIMICNTNIPWDISIIGEVANAIANCLTAKGYLIYYPSIVYGKDESNDSTSLFFNT